MIIGAAMGVLGIILLLVGCLATGETRSSVYRADKARVGGRICGAVFMGIVYVLNLVWLLMLCCLVIITSTFTVFWAICSSDRILVHDRCIDFTQFGFMFPNATHDDQMTICDPGEKKLFCKDYVENAEVMFILATVSCVIVILSLVHYLMCLAANYAHIKDSEKFRDLEEMQRLQDAEMTGLSKERF
ncbi:unnamed protein product [Darwinula stevensoni]|uniref:Neuronal membrane glycoprotein M6-a n=1 Tax=Darwinula stevensoni TaxID=69355 RepID=A0A7R8XFQ3_9CRUS|nr:unnamed protein product [Darwinula stevensoni]CAG0890786.1 unnamed protein product [Darwinula stevensoni]